MSLSAKRTIIVSGLLLALLLAAALLGVAGGATGSGVAALVQLLPGAAAPDPTLATIVWQIRFPRVLLAALVGAALSLGGLVFQALLRNPLSEPYILGISGGSAVGAIIGIMLGLPRFPGVGLTAFAGGMATLLVVLLIASGRSFTRSDTLLLSGVMVNAFCSAIILFLVALVRDSRLHNILFWLMGDLSLAKLDQVGLLALTLLPCFAAVFCLSQAMNLLTFGREMASSMGLAVKLTTTLLLVLTSLMVSATVCQCGLMGFVGLVIPHLLRLLLGPDHRVLAPACLLGGASYLVLCDLVARVLPGQGETPVGVITAMIGAPFFIFLLKRSRP
jgi:iron complex transport system permease protein